MSHNLTQDECSVLNKIAEKTKMDCWFYIGHDNNKPNKPYIYDLEFCGRIDTKSGIEQLMDGVDCREIYDNICLTNEEEQTLKKLLHKMQIEWSVA